MTSAEKICAELRELGLEPEIISADGFINNTAVALRQMIPTGRFKGKTVRFAIGFQEDSYPAYPPHFIYVTGLQDSQIPVHTTFEYDNHQWMGFSVPPSDFWDGLPTSRKNMETYVNRHVLRFWSQI